MKHSAKRVDIVSISLVKESSLLYEPRKLLTSENFFTLIKNFIGSKDREHLIVVGVNPKNEPNIINVVHIGSVTQCTAHVREIMKPLILSNSVSFFIGHNHTSGHLEPSKNDIEFTKRLKKAGELIGIQLVDHLIIDSHHFYSLKGGGYC